MTAPRRIAHVWTPEGVADVKVKGEWPDVIAIGAWIYGPNLAADLRPLVRRGRWSGVEYVEYRSRRRISCEDVPALIEADVDDLGSVTGTRLKALVLPRRT